MRRAWFSLILSGLCISLVPACSPLLKHVSANDPPVLQTAEREAPVEVSRAGATSEAPSRPGPTDASLKPAASDQNLIEPVRFPGAVTRPDLIPEPRNVAEPPTAVNTVLPPEAVTEGTAQRNEKAERAEESPVLQALRCFLDKRPAEAAAHLGRCDRSSQDLLLFLLPFIVRLGERSWEQSDPREATADVEKLDSVADRVSAALRPRAKLMIKKLCFCTEIKEYGKLLPWPDGKGFPPGETADIYVELDNLWDQRRGNEYSIHLRCTIEILDFKRHILYHYAFPDVGPDVSQSQRHDFYKRYLFVVPKDLAPGYYTLSLKITDAPTHREVIRTLDFRVTSAHGKGQW